MQAPVFCGGYSWDYNEYLSDWYKYDIADANWEQIASLSDTRFEHFSLQMDQGSKYQFAIAGIILGKEIFP